MEWKGGPDDGDVDTDVDLGVNVGGWVVVDVAETPSGDEVPIWNEGE